MALLDELLVRIGMDSSGVDEGAEQVESRLDKLSGPAAAAGLAAGAVFAIGVSSAMDIAEAQTKLQNSLGLTQEEAARAGDIAGDVFSAGFGESMGEVADSVGSVAASLGGLGEHTDAELQDMTKAALGLAKTFGVDVAESTQAVSTLIANDLVKDGKEGFDVLVKAAQTLPGNMMADIPATVAEYGKHWARIGLDAKTAFGMMSQYVAAGGRDIDQAGDVLHEFARITSEETDKAAAAFKGLGLNSAEMLADIHKGGEPAKAALQKTIEALRGVKDEGKQSALAVELFGDMAGEGADALWAMDPATAAASSGMANAAGSAKTLTDNMEASPAQQLTAAMNTFKTTLGEALLPILLKVSHFMSEHQGLMKILIPVVIGLAIVFGIFALAVWAVNIAMMANPIAWIILGIIALIAIVIVLVAKWDWVKQQLGVLWDWIKDKAGAVWGWIKDYLAETWEQIQRNTGKAIDFFNWLFSTFNPLNLIMRAWGAISPWISDQWRRVQDSVSRAVGRIGGFFSGMWDGIVSGLKGALNGAIGLINGAIYGINVLISGANRVPGINIPSIPYIPYLAEGGITTGPTLAMIGEGREQEAVLPLSRLEQMINSQGTAAPSVGKVQTVTTRVELDVTGGDSAFVEFFKEVVRVKAGGSVVRLAED